MSKNIISTDNLGFPLKNLDDCKKIPFCKRNDFGFAVRGFSLSKHTNVVVYEQGLYYGSLFHGLTKEQAIETVNESQLLEKSKKIILEMIEECTNVTDDFLKKCLKHHTPYIRLLAAQYNNKYHLVLEHDRDEIVVDFVRFCQEYNNGETELSAEIINGPEYAKRKIFFDFYLSRKGDYKIPKKYATVKGEKTEEDKEIERMLNNINNFDFSFNNENQDNEKSFFDVNDED